MPGPLRLAVRGEQLWLAGGGRGESALWRYVDGWTSRFPKAHGLRDVLPIDNETCVVCGESGYLAVIRDEIIQVAVDTRECLFAVAKDSTGTIWIGGEQSLWRMHLGDKAATKVLATTTRIAHIVPAPDGTIWLATGAGLERLHGDALVTELRTSAPLTGIAIAPDGAMGLSGDAGTLYVGGRKLAAPAIDLECIAYDPARGEFTVGGENGYLGRIGSDGTLTPLPAVEPVCRVTSLVTYRGGLLCAGWWEKGPPYVMRGALFWEGPDDAAPAHIPEPPRQELPAPRTRSFEPSAPLVELGAALDLSLEEAKARMPELSWPETRLERVRFIDGSVRVSHTKELLASNNNRGYAVAIRGDLIVDGPLDAVAGGDGYDSVLAVGGNLWCESAIFRYGIKATIGGAFETATVIVCSHGDDGGLLWAGSFRAQVLAYSAYFPRPDGEPGDTFYIGDVYGDESFPPGRANEIFVAEVLDEDGLDENELAAALRAGTPVLR